jgi:hypothetical protein
MEDPIFIPTLSHWEYGNVWSGEHGKARFLIVPKDGQLTAELWLGPMSREFAQVEQTQVFPISEEGLQALSAWLLEGSRQLNGQAAEG